MQPGFIGAPILIFFIMLISILQITVHFPQTEPDTMFLYQLELPLNTNCFLWKYFPFRAHSAFKEAIKCLVNGSPTMADVVVYIISFTRIYLCYVT